MGLWSRRIFWAVQLLLVLLARPALAAEVDFPSPDTAVTARGTTTYLDLARHFVPDIKAADGAYVGKSLIALRHLGGSPYQNSDEDSFGFFDVGTVHMKAEGKERQLVLFDFAQAGKTLEGVAVLALYDVSGEPKLLDAVDIGFDQSTFFFERGLLPISPDSDAILTMSSHFNSSQSYVTVVMAMVRKDRLELIDTVSLFDEKACGFERHQTISYAANPGAGKPYAPINVVVTDATTATIEDCGDGAQPSASQRQVRTTYKWQTASARYMPDSDVLMKLAKENEGRF
jgi:hypothetical protein